MEFVKIATIYPLQLTPHNMIVLYCHKAYKDQNYDRIPEANLKI